MSQPPKVCAVCGRSLAGRSDEDGNHHGYFHFRETDDDHIAVPVEPAEIEPKWRCDFCDLDLGESWWVLPVETYTHIERVPGFDPLISVGDWAMCDECNACVSAKAWGRLVTRQMDGHRRAHPGKPNLVPRKALVEHNETLWRHVTGDPYEVHRQEQ